MLKVYADLCKDTIIGLLGWLGGKESFCQHRRHSLIPDPGRSHMPWSS